MRLGGQEMAAAKQLLEHPEEVLDQPPQAIHLTDQLGGKIEAIRSTPQEAVAVGAGASAATLATTRVRRGRHGHDPYGMIENDLRLGARTTSCP